MGNRCRWRPMSKRAYTSQPCELAAIATIQRCDPLQAQSLGNTSHFLAKKSNPLCRRRDPAAAVHSAFNHAKCSAASAGCIPSTSSMSGSVGAVVCSKPDGVERDVATCDGLCVPEALLQDTDRKPAPAARVAGAPRPQVRPSTLPSATPPAARSTDGLQSHTTSTNQESPQDFSALSPLTQADHPASSPGSGTPSTCTTTTPAQISKEPNRRPSNSSGRRAPSPKEPNPSARQRRGEGRKGALYRKICRRR
jgi:hypothetical protein